MKSQIFFKENDYKDSCNYGYTEGNLYVGRKINNINVVHSESFSNQKLITKNSIPHQTSRSNTKISEIDFNVTKFGVIKARENQAAEILTNRPERVLYKAFLSLFLIFIFFFMVSILPKSVLSHGSEAGNVKVDDVVKEILQKQSVSDVKNLDCNKVSDEDFEKLGEAIMNYMHPDEKEHEVMDEMMGGEGSESLRQAHIAMGKRFLGCNNFPGFMGMGPWMMMGRGMMGFDGFGYSGVKSSDIYERGWLPMMGFGMGSGFALVGLTWFITWLALIIFLILGSIYFYKEIKKNNKKKRD